MAALAGDFVDTRVTFTVADDNVLAGAAEQTPPSPDTRIGGGAANTQFYDNYETRYSGFESLTNLVLYKKSDSWIPTIITEAALALTLIEFSESATPGSVNFIPRDASSYARITWSPEDWGEKEGLSLTAFPWSADRFRLGYSYRLSWGGSSTFLLGQSVPGAKLQLTRERWYAFIGAKTTLIPNPVTPPCDCTELVTRYAGLGGFGIDFTDRLRWEINGGYFQQGIFQGQPLAGKTIHAAGASTQVAWHVGMPVGSSVDFALYRNDPEKEQRWFVPETYGDGLSYEVKAEVSYLTHTLEKFSTANFGSTEHVPAIAGDVQARAKWNKLRAHLTAMYRDLEYVLFNVPGLVPYKTLPPGKSRPELFASVGVDYYLEDWHLTPGFVAGVQLPAAFTPSQTFSPGGNNPPVTLEGRRTVVIRDPGFFSVLPNAKDDPAPIYAGKVNAKFEVSESMAAAAEVYYTYDANRTTVRQSDEGVVTLVYEKPHQLGFNLLLQARF
jgi:hypothetical protein